MMLETVSSHSGPLNFKMHDGGYDGLAQRKAPDENAGGDEADKPDAESTSGTKTRGTKHGRGAKVNYRASRHDEFNRPATSQDKLAELPSNTSIKCKRPADAKQAGRQPLTSARLKR